jgi:hypothetical protein
MRHHNYPRAFVLLGASLAACVALFSGAVDAQDRGAPDWLRVNIVNVVPERLEDYVELQLKEVNPALQKAGVPWRSVWRTAEFGNSYEMQFVTPLGDLSDYDTGGPLARALPPDRVARLADRLRRSTVSRRSYAVQYRPELSVESAESSGLFLARLTTIEVAPGLGASWTSFLERNLPRFRGADVVFGVYQRLFGPGPTAWQLVENYQSFTELNETSIIGRAFGEDADAVTAELAGVVSSVERTVLRYDAELSYTSEPSR